MCHPATINLESQDFFFYHILLTIFINTILSCRYGSGHNDHSLALFKNGETTYVLDPSLDENHEPKSYKLLPTLNNLIRVGKTNEIYTQECPVQSNNNKDCHALAISILSRVQELLASELEFNNRKIDFESLDPTEKTFLLEAFCCAPLTQSTNRLRQYIENHLNLQKYKVNRKILKNLLKHYLKELEKLKKD